MCTEPTVEVSREAVLIRTAGVRKCPLRMSAPHTLVQLLVHFWDRTPPVQGAMGLPACALNLWHRMCTEPMAVVIREAVLNRTAGVQKCRLRMSAPHWLVKRLVHFRYRTPKVQGVIALPRMSTERMAEVMCPSSVTCIHPYIGCTKMPFVHECSP